MPELPEVHTFNQYFRKAALQQTIQQVRVADDKILRNVSGEAFIDLMTGRTFVDTYRRGKYLFARLDNQHDILLHFGMTGDLKYYAEPEEAPKHERFAFEFTDGMHLGFDCPRKFARILYLEDRDAYIKEVGLGEDALTIELTTFLDKTSQAKGTIKGWLLNQSNLAGVGNLYADVACYRARVHPGSTTRAISKKKRKELFQHLQEILQQAVDQLPYYKSYPKPWIWDWRVEGHPAPNGKGKAEHAKIGGRTTYFNKAWQKLYV